jgi:hypothetical protein
MTLQHVSTLIACGAVAATAFQVAFLMRMAGTPHAKEALRRIVRM